MKIKTDFVTNSSSQSFVIIGIYVGESDLPKEKVSYEDFESNIDNSIKGSDLDYSFGDPNGYNDKIMIGTHYTQMGDDETLGEFKARVQKQIKDYLGIESKPGHIESSWENR